jgi:hypothetical protein
VVDDRLSHAPAWAPGDPLAVLDRVVDRIAVRPADEAGDRDDADDDVGTPPELWSQWSGWKAAMAENSSRLSQGPAEKIRPSSAKTLPRGPASFRAASKRYRTSVTRRAMASSCPRGITGWSPGDMPSAKQVTK